jgi:3',5'-cyclic AMP phosphodiesterase CpdA
MLKILHISDIHFGPPFVPKVGEALLRIAPTLEPTLIVASGDFTQRATREQFQEAQAFLRLLPKAPLVVTPGNHDIPLYRFRERFFNPYDLYREYIQADLDYVTQIEGAFIVSLNSTSPKRSIINGRIHLDQLEFCTQAFRSAPEDSVKILVSHHHFAPAPDYEGSSVMPKAKRAMNRFIDVGVEVILGGHLHRAYIGNSLDIYPGKHRDRGIIIVQCGTSTSRRGRAREREKNSFNMLWIDQRMIRVTHYMYFDEEDGFAPISRHLFPRPGHRFVEATAIHH